ncbi:MAG: DUF5615 family PIN-like protein [SAR324 cluster bacterium]|nr:DUF5615 family PIN-like protein [SAR324 cluster bacterium]
MQILTDENISPKVVAFLRQQGVNVLDAKEQKWYGFSDAELLEIAFREKRFILTHDSDFGTLAMNEGKACYGILYLRFKNVHPQNVISICEQFLKQDHNLLPGTIVVLEETRLRIRSR